jgi:hypothetical protein
VYSISSYGVKVIVRQMDDMRSAAFYCACKTGIVLDGTRERHWLILPSQRIKKNGQDNGWPAFHEDGEQIIY